MINDTEEHNSIPVNPEYTNVYRAVIIKIPNEIFKNENQKETYGGT